MKDLYICRACWLVATPKIIAKGSSRIEIMLWCLFIIPGLIYTLWLLITREKVFPRCLSLAIIPVNSARGQQHFKGVNSIYNKRFIIKSSKQ